jgi:hypothetical protein
MAPIAPPKGMSIKGINIHFSKRSSLKKMIKRIYIKGRPAPIKDDLMIFF